MKKIMIILITVFSVLVVGAGVSAGLLLTKDKWYHKSNTKKLEKAYQKSASDLDNEKIYKFEEYTDANGTQGYKITAYTGSDTKITIPETYCDKPVLRIDNGVFKNNETLESLHFYVDDGRETTGTLTEIGAEAFQNAIALQSIEFPTSLVKIEEYAFNGCSALGYIYTEKSSKCMLQTIGDYAFADAGTSSFSFYISDKLQTIGDYAFKGSTVGNLSYNYSGSSDTVKSQLTSIGDYAFNASSIRSIDFSYFVNLQTIGNCAFMNCSSLNSVDLTSCSSLTEIKGYAFSGSNVSYVYLPNKEGITIGERAMESNYSGGLTVHMKQLPASMDIYNGMRININYSSVDYNMAIRFVDMIVNGFTKTGNSGQNTVYLYVSPGIKTEVQNYLNNNSITSISLQS